MYNPAHFAEDRPEVLHAFLRENPLAALVTNGPNGPDVTHAPMIFHSEENLLRCHFARANRHWESIAQAPVLAIFAGPDHYISPSWYPGKQEDGKVVPTWNYVAVHVRGRGSVFQQIDRLVEHVSALTAANEAAREKPWAVADAPRAYIEGLARGIVGIEIAIESIEGKWKVSQNRPPADRRGVMAALVRERGGM